MKKVAIAVDGYPYEKGGEDFSHYEYDADELTYGDIDDTIEVEIIKAESDRIEILAKIPHYSKMADGRTMLTEYSTYRRGVATVNPYGVIKAWISPKALDLYSRDLFVREVECEWFGAARFDTIENAAEWVKLALCTWKGA